MMKAVLATSSLAVALALGGCTTVLKTSVPSASGVSQGFAYQLPRAAYDAEVTRVLSRCPTSETDTVGFDITAKATERSEAGETIVIDYVALGNGLKTTDIAFERFPTGMLKTVNLTVNDHTADVISEGVRAAVSIGKIAIGLPGGGAAGAGKVYNGGTVPYLRCSSTAKDAVESLPSLKAAIKAAQKTSEAAAKKLSDLTGAGATAKKPSAEEVAKLTKEARDDADALSDAQKKLSDTNTALTLVDDFTVHLPDGGQVKEAHRLTAATAGKTHPESLLEVYFPSSLDPKGVQRWFGVPLTPTLTADTAKASANGYATDPKSQADLASDKAVLAGQGAKFTTILAQLGLADVTAVAGPLTPPVQATSLPASPQCANSAADCGILYRSPSPGRLRVCGGADAKASDPDLCFARVAGDTFILYQEERQIPQYGRLMSLPLTNKAFANNVLTAEFSEDGGIVKFGYKKPVAEAQAALASANTVLGGATDLITYQNGKALRTLQAEKALNEAKLAAATSEDNLTPSEVSVLKKQTDLINAQIDLANAQAKSQPSQVTQVQNQTDLIDAQLKQVQKLIELAKAKQQLEALATPTATNP